MIEVQHFLVLSLASYAATTVLAASDIAKPFRVALRSVFALAHSPMLVRWYETDGGLKPILEDENDRDPEIENIIGTDPAGCRLCMGFWVALIACLIAKVFSPLEIFGVYGLSYFLATQERKW